MRFLLMHKLDQFDESQWAPSPEFITAMGNFVEEAINSGTLLAADGVQPPVQDGALVRVSTDGATVTDGPFAETKEVIAGYAVLQVDSRDEALEWAKQFGALFDFDVEVEVRRVTEFADFEPGSVPEGEQERGDRLRGALEGRETS